ncbi:sigma-70 family RNA polymerase sigma factor [Vallitalea sediminicola]
MVNGELEEIYIKYNKELYLYVFSLCKNHHIAEEIVSETFYRALISINICESHIKLWLLRVAKNLWFDGIRRNKYTLDKPIEEMNLDSHTNILDQFIYEDKRKFIYKSLLKLPQNYKDIMVLYYYCDFSLKDISLMLNISYSSSRTLLHRARRKLKNIMEANGYEQF